ncbi:MAG: hypothetical protein IPK77_11230 [Cellvibrio sp.]|nr:hypothetical protein [Cellvibrio sp.]
MFVGTTDLSLSCPVESVNTASARWPLSQTLATKPESYIQSVFSSISVGQCNIINTGAALVIL